MFYDCVLCSIREHVHVHVHSACIVKATFAFRVRVGFARRNHENTFVFDLSSIDGCCVFYGVYSDSLHPCVICLVKPVRCDVLALHLCSNVRSAILTTKLHV